MRRSIGRCPHRVTITTITAGLAREVCETCARVTIRYVGPAVLVDSQSPRPDQCDLCTQTAAYWTPDALVCREHAWQAAAKQDWNSEPWVPIPIDPAYI